MKGFAEFVLFLFVALAWVAVDWLARNAQNILFTLGLVSIIVGLSLERVSLAFIVPGSIVCGLLVLSRLRSAPVERKGGGDA